MSNLCIIPARGSSKRIPRKNIKIFFGKPIIAYSIEAAINSGLFDEIMVSTDDSEIAKVAKDCGAKVPFLRSIKNSDDFATTFDVIEEVVLKYQSEGRSFDKICCLYSCAPFISVIKLRECLNLLIAKNFDSVFPVMSFGFPIQRALEVNDENKISYFYPEYALARSQDFKSSYHDAGQFYWIDTKKCMAEKRILTENSGSVTISELEGQDIDNLIDWKLAELKYELLQSTK